MHGYHDRPENLQFLCNNSLGRYDGLELEIDNGEDMEYCAEDLAYVLDKRAWFNQDGSLEETGFEIITHPATINYHLHEFPWDAVCDIAKDHGYRSIIPAPAVYTSTLAEQGSAYDGNDN